MKLPEHLQQLSDILGPEVSHDILSRLYEISKGDLNRAIDLYYEKYYAAVTEHQQIPGVPTPQKITTGAKFQPRLSATFGSIGANRDGDLFSSNHSSVAGPSSLSYSIAGHKRKLADSFFPKYLGEITVVAYALGSMAKVKAGEAVLLERTKPNPQLQLGRKKKAGVSGPSNTGWGGRALKENNVVRFTKESGFEIGRLPADTSRWVAKLLDYGLAEFKGTIIYIPDVVCTGTEIILSMKCYLTAAAFVALGANNKLALKGKTANTIVQESLETEDELDLKYRKYAVNAMFRDLALTPIATNSSVGPRDRTVELFSSTPDGSSTPVNENEELKEEEPEVSEKELDVLYEKAQKHGRDFAPMDPPESMTYTLKPYQRIALAWMFDKETRTETNGNHQTMHPLWEAYEFQKEDGYEPRSDVPKRYYLNPYSSEMSLDFPTSDQVCRGGILADEMGLGKTIEILSLVHANGPIKDNVRSAEASFARLTTSPESSSRTAPPGTDYPPRRTSPTTLIVCPMSLLSQWRDEAINSSDGKLSVEVYYGGSRGWNDETLLLSSAPDVLVTSYGTVMSEYSTFMGRKISDGPTSLSDIRSHNDWRKGSALFNVDFHRIVLDEAHQIKSRVTKTAKACYALNSTRRWVVTGTPIQNKLEDLFSLVHFLRCEPWSNFSFWRTFITIPFESKDKDKAMKVITSVLEPLVLRRTKATKDEDGNPIVMLPERVIEIEYLQFSEPENDIYQALFKDGKTKFNHYCRAGTVLRHYASIFQLLMRMRQVCDHPVLVVGRHKAGGADRPVDGPVQLEELMAKFSGEGDQGESFGASVIQGLLTGSEATTECPVCFEDMADGVLLPCMHSGCRTCVMEYLQLRDDKGEPGECPVCRHSPISETDLIEYTTSSPTVVDGSVKESDHRSDFVAGNVLGVNNETAGPNNSRLIQMRRNNFKSSAKLDALMRHLNQVRKTEPKTKSVVFSQFTGMLDLAEAILDRDGFQYLRLDGTHSQSSREKTLESFKGVDHPATVILISLRAGGVGLNLTAASRVYMLDPWWNYAIESQAIDRVHRIGQTKPVLVKRFIIEGSVEEKILSIQNRKNALASGLGMTKMEAQGARMEDLQEIFS
ncbi:DNA helicase rad5 [Podila humilis]|nr:DNA helicase rad5 [Podila humilis]